LESLQIPTGMILDRFGVRKVYRVSTFLWSLTSAATASANRVSRRPAK
jgi:nitrate/nitrite transporter NarK